MEAATAFADLDFETLSRRLAAQFRSRSIDDVEEAVADALVEVAEVAEREEVRSASALVSMRARWRMLKLVKRADREVSLDDLSAGDEDEPPRDLAIAEDQLDVHVELSEVEEHPILAARLRAASAGAAPILAPRGGKSHAARYSDEQVAEVRRLRNEEKLKFAEIAELTGVEKSYCSQICRGRARLLPSTEGWTEARMIEAIEIFARREKRAPTYQEAQQRADLPTPSIACERWGITWRQLLERAGVPSSREWRRSAPWTLEEAKAILLDFYHREGRIPRKSDLRSPLPAPMTVRNLFGSWSMVVVAEALGVETA